MTFCEPGLDAINGWSYFISPGCELPRNRKQNYRRVFSCLWGFFHVLAWPILTYRGRYRWWHLTAFCPSDLAGIKFWGETWNMCNSIGLIKPVSAKTPYRACKDMSFSSLDMKCKGKERMNTLPLLWSNTRQKVARKLSFEESVCDTVGMSLVLIELQRCWQKNKKPDIIHAL